MSTFNFTPSQSSIDAAGLRNKIRDFLATALQKVSARERAYSWTGFNANISEAMGKAGWIGMQWPEQYGGRDASPLERYVVIEELLAAGAPVGAHWIADRQSGTHLLRYGSERVKREYLPKIAAGELYFCIGMSEPNAGSDLAAIATHASHVDGGWKINGAKLWTTHVVRSQMMIALVRTDRSQQRHGGMSQFLIDLSLPGITIKGISDQTGEEHFGEVFFDDVLVPEDCLIGVEGEGWQQVNAELALERSGPERYLSSYRLIEEFLSAQDETSNELNRCALGQWAAELWTLRQMSLSMAGQISEGKEPSLEAAMVKDLGATFEQSLPHQVEALLDDEAQTTPSALREVLDYLLLASPSFSLRGGTREILRGIIARGLGLR
ncbi:acyl-CoA dehydrogenase family protein [Dasania marina]|uniref:acyl-CoA dehydrogenase family protein n=1 Tax=Dasania marina TaxID=471499 RepID=UPI00037F93D3|nr:acyl-CoA dehydrogenase family protein [Dasania marina]